MLSITLRSNFGPDLPSSKVGGCLRCLGNEVSGTSENLGQVGGTDFVAVMNKVPKVLNPE